jgi:hypothetical protein
MENVFFKPWLGEQYTTGGFSGRKILILGESHHCGDLCKTCGIIGETECENFTTNVINSYLNYKKKKINHENWMNTFTRFTNILIGTQINSDETISFWNSVIFYNYVQIALEGPRMSPSLQDFTRSKNAFIEVINEYKPDLIIIWGERLWAKLDKLKDDGYWGEEILDGRNGKIFYFRVSDINIPAYKIYHPASSAFCYEDSKYLQEALRLVK